MSSDPTVSRLRSHMRNPSDSSILTMNSGIVAGSVASSHFSNLSRSDSNTTLHTLAEPAPPSPAKEQEPFRWMSLRKVSATLFGWKGKGKADSLLGCGGMSEKLGNVTVMDTSGLLSFGTDKGWVAIFDFRQELRCVVGIEASSELVGLWLVIGDKLSVELRSRRVRCDLTFPVPGSYFSCGRSCERRNLPL